MKSRDGLRYGLLGLPLAFVALPLYVILPNHYAREFGIPLATLGLILLAVVLALNVLIASVRRWRERAEGQTGALNATALGVSA